MSETDTWRPDAEPWEALAEATSRVEERLNADAAVEDLASMLSEMGWRLAPASVPAGDSVATGLRRGHLADLEVVEAILRSDPRDRASGYDAEPGAMADAVRAIIENPELHNPGSFTGISVPVPESEKAELAYTAAFWVRLALKTCPITGEGREKAEGSAAWLESIAGRPADPLSGELPWSPTPERFSPASFYDDGEVHQMMESDPDGQWVNINDSRLVFSASPVPEEPEGEWKPALGARVWREDHRGALYEITGGPAWELTNPASGLRIRVPEPILRRDWKPVKSSEPAPVPASESDDAMTVRVPDDLAAELLGGTVGPVLIAVDKGELAHWDAPKLALNGGELCRRIDLIRDSLEAGDEVEDVAMSLGALAGDVSLGRFYVSPSSGNAAPVPVPESDGEVFEAVATEITEAYLRHYGFTDKQIAEIREPADHSACEISFDEQNHLDEDGKSRHPLHDIAYNAAEGVVFVLEHPALRRLFPAPSPVPEGERTFSEGQLSEAIRWLEQKQAEDSIVTPWAIFTFLDGRASPVPEEPEGENYRKTARRLAMEKVDRDELLAEFDAWLSFRPEFSEVLTAFREAFGTDTSADGAPVPVEEPEPCENCGYPERCELCRAVLDPNAPFIADAEGVKFCRKCWAEMDRDEFARRTAEPVEDEPSPATVEEPETEKCCHCGGTGWLDDETGLGAEMKDTVSASGCPECHVPGECGGRGCVPAPAPEIKVGQRWRLGDAILRVVGRRADKWVLDTGEPDDNGFLVERSPDWFVHCELVGDVPREIVVPVEEPERDCIDCGEGMPKGDCPKSEAPCGHHCNHLWTHDECHWCGTTINEDGDEVPPAGGAGKRSPRGHRIVSAEPSPAPEKCGNCGAEHNDPMITDDVCRGLDDWSAGYERGRAEAAAAPSPAPEIKEQIVEDKSPPTDEDVEDSRRFYEGVRERAAAPEIKVGQEPPLAWLNREIAALHKTATKRMSAGRFLDPEQRGRLDALVEVHQRMEAAPSLDLEGLARLDADIRRLVSKKADLEVYVAGRLLGLQQARSWLVSTPSEEAENGE